MLLLFFKLPPSVVCGLPDITHTHTHGHVHTVLICFLNKQKMRSYSLFDLEIAFFTLRFFMTMYVRIFKCTILFLTAVLFHYMVIESCTQ